jgi:hypothetical protein
MQENSTMLVNSQPSSATGDNNSFSQYLSFRFQKENVDHSDDATKGSINNFIKSNSEIDEDFLTILQSQPVNNLELHDFGFTDNVVGYMEENY